MNNPYLIEKYSINGTGYRVFELGPSEYHLEISRKNGDWVHFGVAPTPKTIAEVRAAIHSHAISQTNAELHGYQERVTQAQRTLEKLGGYRQSVEELGKFRV